MSLRASTAIALAVLGTWLALPGTAAAQASIFASPDVTTDLSGTPVRDREGAIDDFGGLPDGADVVALQEEVGGRVLFASDVTVSLPGPLVARPADVVRTNGAIYALEFDGAASGVPEGAAVDAVARSASGQLVLSFDVAVDLGGVRADDEDLVSYDGSVFTLLLDASAEGVDPALDLDGAAYAGEDRYAVSFDGGGSVDGVVFADEDVITLRPGGPDALMFFDASAEHAGWAGSDLDAVALPEPGAASGVAAGIGLLVALAQRRARASARPRAPSGGSARR